MGGVSVDDSVEGNGRKDTCETPPSSLVHYPLSVAWFCSVLQGDRGRGRREGGAGCQ